MEMQLQAFIGETAEGRMPSPIFDEWADRFTEAGDPLVIEADTVEEALEEFYRLANIGVNAGDSDERFDWVRSYRERDRSRSLSVGDVVVVSGEMGYTVDSMGFRPVNEQERAALEVSA